MNKYTGCFLTFFMIWGFGSSAQSSTPEKITIEQGLSQGMVYDILQTRDGFLWVATKDGLNRYDGNNFKVFTNNPFDPFSLSQNNVTVLFEDSRGLLWLGLDSKGLDVFDPKTGRFHHFPLDFKRQVMNHGLDVRRVAELPDGSIWVLSIGIGLVRIALPEAWEKGLPAEPLLEKWAKPEVFKIEMDLNAKPLPEAILDLNLLANGDLLATSNHHQFQIEPKTGIYKVVNPGMLTVNARWSVQGDEAFGGDLWVGQGTEIRRLRGGQIKSFVPPGAFCNLTLEKGQKGHVWLSLCGKLWDLEPGEDLDFSKPDLTLDATITCLEQDKNGNLWLGTSGYGLRKINAIGKRFHTGGTGNSVRGLWRDPAGRYFVKSLSDIKNYDPVTCKLGSDPAFSKNELDELCLTFDPDGTTWLLCRESGSVKSPALRRYAPDGSFVKSYVFEATSLSDLLLRLRDGTILIGTGQCLVVHFDPRTERFEYVNFAHLFGDKAGSVRITALAESDDGQLWAGTQRGLVKFALKTKSGSKVPDFQLFEADPNKPDGLNNNSIACILPTPDGQLWLGTKGGGINVLDPKTGRCRHITTDDGLLNNVVYGILPGSRAGEFWCSTNRGLAKVTASQTLGITTYTATAGLQDNEFNTNAYFKADNGELLFGGVNGLNRFFPGELRPDTTPPPVCVVGLEINRKKADFGSPGSPLTAPLEMTRSIELSFDQNNVSFEFAALDLTDPSKNRYRFRLVGLENDWVEAGAGRFAHYAHLPPGRYELRVQGSNGESRWRDATPIYIVVNPPWYRSDLAYLCYLALLFWAALRVYQFQIRRVKEREQLAFEQRETERVRALEQMKTNFFSNVTHEFRTPLTLMFEPLRRILQKTKDPDVLENAHLAEANSRKLLSLVNQLLDMAKLESGQMALDLRRGDLGETVRGAFERFLPLAEKRGVKLLFPASPTDLEAFDFDPGKVELILNNLISNALKFTPEGGQVRVTVEGSTGQFHNSSTPRFLIKVSDTGIGIATENLEKVFDRFYQVDGSNTRAGQGTGIGLALSKELAELMGGGISVESEPGKGSTFTFWLPLNGEELRNRGIEELTEQGASADLTTLKLSNLKPTITPGEQPVALVIEDNTELRSFIKKSIGENWQVVEAADGAEGIEKAIELLPDLVISDLMMPRKDGFAVVEELKNNELTAHVPVILLSAKSAIESRIAGLRRGADDYLTKPFSTDELLARMENLVETRRHLRQLFAKEVSPGGSSAFSAAVSAMGDSAAATEATKTSGEPFLTEFDQSFLQKFTELVEQNLSKEDLSLDDFARELFISRSQLHRKIKALLDQSPMDFVRDYRLNRAFSLLKNSDARVWEVAEQVGFRNEKYFSTAFKEKFGISPSQV